MSVKRLMAHDDCDECLGIGTFEGEDNLYCKCVIHIVGSEYHPLKECDTNCNN